MSFNDKSPVALYYQVERQIRKLIENEELKPGDYIPSENELIERFKVSRITIRRALERLEEDNLIVKKRGSKSIVSDAIHLNRAKVFDIDDFRGMEDELRNHGHGRDTSVLEHVKLHPHESIANLLGLSESDEAIRIQRIASAGDIPLWLETRYFRSMVGERLAKDDLENESVQNLMKNLGLKVERVNVQISATCATSAQAKLLKVEKGFPLLVHEFISYAKDMVALQVTRVHLRGDYHKLILYAVPQEEVSGLDIVGGGYNVVDFSDKTEEIK